MRTVATSKRPFPCTVGSWSGPHKGKGSQLCVLPYLFFSTTLGGGFSQFTEEEPEPQGCTWQVLNLKRGLCCFQHLSLPWHPCHSGDWSWDQDQGVPLTWGGAPSMCADHGNPSSLPPAGLPPHALVSTGRPWPGAGDLGSQLVLLGSLLSPSPPNLDVHSPCLGR